MDNAASTATGRQSSPCSRMGPTPRQPGLPRRPHRRNRHVSRKRYSDGTTGTGRTCLLLVGGPAKADRQGWPLQGGNGSYLDTEQLPAYTYNMSAETSKPVSIPCLCLALRRASRAVSRLYDEELRGVGLRTTQYSVLRLLRDTGEVRQRDLGEVT